jgi:hypothetical protein
MNIFKSSLLHAVSYGDQLGTPRRPQPKQAETTDCKRRPQSTGIAASCRASGTVSRASAGVNICSCAGDPVQKGMRTRSRKADLFVSPHRYREHTPERSPAAQAVVRSVLTKFMTVVV